MKIDLLTPDVAPQTPQAPSDADHFMAILDDVGASLSSAQRAEDAYAHGGGSLGDAVYERARADVTLSVATAAAQRTAQAITSLFNLQL